MPKEYYCKYDNAIYSVVIVNLLLSWFAISLCIDFFREEE